MKASGDRPAATPAVLFGTDGIRGPAGEPPLDAASLAKIGRALGRHLADQSPAPRTVLAGDTRSSTPEICSWLAWGLRDAGCDTEYGGILPTPAVARLTSSTGAALGIAVSASHNPFPDNGVKLLDANGFKWSRTREEELEGLIASEPELTGAELDGLTNLELPAPLPEFRSAYLRELVEIFPTGSLAGLSIVLDSANGAATGLSAELFEALGATVTSLGDRPDGTNINQGCGSTWPELAARETKTSGADLGFAFDGDADRAIAIDKTGAILDGDAMLYVVARWLKGSGELDPPAIVATTMSNLGLQEALDLEGIELVRCDVGDRTVVETLRGRNLVLGGEQSGHLVHMGMSSTGDGLVSAALLSSVVASTGRPLSELTAGFRRFPQILRNIEVAGKPDLASLPAVVAQVRKVEGRLGRHGRLVLRYSGTEPLARVMIEGRDQNEIEALAESLASTIASEIANLEHGG